METKNKSDVAGIAAATSGSLAGAGAVLTAVSTGGPVAGLGAAGITSGLASVGGAVGGGMAAGLITVAAAPIVTGAIAYGGYKLVRWFLKK